jgi:subtilisin family serine protease
VKLLAVAAMAGALCAVSAHFAAPSLSAAGSRSDESATWAVTRVDASRAWPLVRNHTAPRVAILDSGIDATHPSLTGKVATARDFVDATGDTSDASWHGTAVAGVTLSICPSCTLVSGKVLDAHDAGDDAEIARAVLWAVKSGARVVNLSMSGPDEAPVLRAAIRTATRQGVVVVAAAGNDGSSTKSFPGADPNVIGVAASTSADTLFRWSNRGRWVEIAAPGQATTPLRGGGYTTFLGTSAAAPAVAATAAECLAVAPRLTPLAVRRILLRTSSPLAGSTFGRLDAGAAVAACAAF